MNTLRTAFVIATPISYLVVYWYMLDFVQKLELPLDLLLLSALITTLLSFLTMN